MFRKLLTFLLAGSLLCMTGCAKQEAPQEPAASEAPAEHEETIGIWFSYIEYRDLCAGMNEEERDARIKSGHDAVGEDPFSRER